MSDFRIETKGVVFRDDRKCKRQSLEAHLEVTISGSEGDGELRLVGYGADAREALRSLTEQVDALQANLRECMNNVTIDEEQVKVQRADFEKNNRRYY